MNQSRTAMARLMNMLVRLGNLATKLVFTLYMGRYLGLTDMGVYGLVFGLVMILGGVLGVRLDYAVSRDLVGSDPLSALCKMRDEAVFYLLNHVVLAVIIVVLALTHATNLSGWLLFYIFALSAFESLANMAYANMNSLHQQLLANTLFFIRAGAWTIPVIALGLLNPTFRTVNVVLAFWTLGILTSLIGTMWTWRHMPWRAMRRTEIDWVWIRADVKKCSLVWLGTLGMVAGIYVDRFIVVKFLNIDYVGVGTFYFSFANALFSLVQSGILAFAYPRLIDFHRKRDVTGFQMETRHAHFQVVAVGGMIAVIIGSAVWFGLPFFHRPLLEEEIATLWTLLMGFWLRSIAEVDYYVLFARHQDRAIWLGNLLFLIPAFGFNLLLVPTFGLIGIGYGSILSSLCLIAWRQYAIRNTHTA